MIHSLGYSARIALATYSCAGVALLGYALANPALRPGLMQTTAVVVALSLGWLFLRVVRFRHEIAMDGPVYPLADVGPDALKRIRVALRVALCVYVVGFVACAILRPLPADISSEEAAARAAVLALASVGVPLGALVAAVSVWGDAAVRSEFPEPHLLSSWVKSGSVRRK